MTDPKEEMLAAIAASFARDEERWRRENPRKVRLYLVQAPDESPTFSVEGQAALRKLVSSIRENHVTVDAPVMALDSAEAVGGFTGEIALLVQAVSPILTGILGAWLQSKAGRKLRLKVGDVEVEARTPEEIDQLLKKAEAFRTGREGVDDEA